jgi:hypothetical protein
MAEAYRATFRPLHRARVKANAGTRLRKKCNYFKITERDAQAFSSD